MKFVDDDDDNELSWRKTFDASIRSVLNAVYAQYVDNSAVISLHDWSQLLCCRD